MGAASRRSRASILSRSLRPCALRGGSRNDPERNRYGCFLPDLTGLATTPSARLPRGHMAAKEAERKLGRDDAPVHARTKDPKNLDRLTFILAMRQTRLLSKICQPNAPSGDPFSQRPCILWTPPGICRVRVSNASLA